MDTRQLTEETIAEALGRGQREDGVLAGTGGPAGNARLTAWTGVLLLVLFLAELVTLLDVRGLITWHVVVGILLVPPALLKTGSTGWRILRYYTGNGPYRRAGPPPLPLRVLGPLVVLSTLAVLASGVVVVFIGASSRGAVTVLGQSIDALMLHKASFVIWGILTGLHVLGRLVPAVRLTFMSGGPAPVPGAYRRGAMLGLAIAIAVVSALLVLSLVDIAGWRTPPHRRLPSTSHSSQR